MPGLWTPDGEYEVRRPARTEAGSARAASEDRQGGPLAQGPTSSSLASPEFGDDGRTLSEEEQAAQLAALEERLAAADVEDVVANHCYGLFELAALHLGRQPPNLTSASVAIDGLGALVDRLGDRLGSHAAPLREGLAQLRLAFVQISQATHSAEGAPRS